MIILAKRAIVKPKTRALFLCDSGSRPTKIEMTRILSTPSTNSNPISNDSKAMASVIIFHSPERT